MLVANGGTRQSANPPISLVSVEPGPDEGDKYIVGKAQPSEIVVTADIALAALTLDASVMVSPPNDDVFHHENGGVQRAIRDLMADRRTVDVLLQKRGKGFRKNSLKFLNLL